MSSTDHFYTISQDDVPDYQMERIECYVGNLIKKIKPKISGTIPLYRWYNPNNDDHFYTILSRGIPSYQREGLEGIECYVFDSTISGTVPFYRWYNPDNGDHFYTISPDVIHGYQREGSLGNGVECYVANLTVSIKPRISNTVPLYRWYNPDNEDHFYTTSSDDFPGYKHEGEEGIECYVFNQSVKGAVPLYRWWNPDNGDHFYTISAQEIPGYQREGSLGNGIECYVFISRVPNSVPLYRWYNPDKGRHFYTVFSGNIPGYQREGALGNGVECYVSGFQVTKNPSIPNTVPLYRWYNPDKDRHFYTVSSGDIPGYQREGSLGNGIECYVSSFAVTKTLSIPNTVPLYRWWNPDKGDHFYTVSSEDIPGYQREGSLGDGVECYVFDSNVQNTVPLYRWWNPDNGDHFYTVSSEDIPGYQREEGSLGNGIECYVARLIIQIKPGINGAVPLYRWYNPESDDHFYTISPNGIPSYQREGVEGIECCVFDHQISGTFPLYRWWNPDNGDHFYTISPEDIPGYQREGSLGNGIECYVARLIIQIKPGINGAVPLYRWYNPESGDHFYTISPNGIPSYQREGVEGIECCVFDHPISGTVPLYRWWNPDNGDHFYTISSGDIPGYQREGSLGNVIECYVFDSNVQNTVPLYRWYNPDNGDHFYTVSSEDIPGYQREGSLGNGIECYVSRFQVTKNPSIPNTVPLYRWYNPDKDRHFYTVSSGDIPGYQREGSLGNGIECYVSEFAVNGSPSIAGTIPLFRWYMPGEEEHWYDPLAKPFEIIYDVYRQLYNIADTVKSFIASIPDYLLTLIGIMPEKYLRLCVIIQRDENGNMITSPEIIQPMLQNAIDVFHNEVNVKIIPLWNEYIKIEDKRSNHSTLDVCCDSCAEEEDLGEAGAQFGVMMIRQGMVDINLGIGSADPIAAFAVRSFRDGKLGCSLGPLTDYVTVNFGRAGPSTLTHELGHACNLWHSDDITNLMYGGPGDRQATSLEKWQKALVRASRHVSYIP